MIRVNWSCFGFEVPPYLQAYHEPGHHYAEYGHGDHANHAPHHDNDDDDDSVCSS